MQAVAVTAVRVQGALVLRWTPHEEAPKLHVGFKRLPTIGFDVSLSGKALSLGSDTLRAWLHKQLDRALLAHCVLPKELEADLPFLRLPPGAEAVPLSRGGAEGGHGVGAVSPVGRGGGGGGGEQLVDMLSHEGLGLGVDLGGWDAAVSQDESLRQLLGLRMDSFLGPTWVLDEALAAQLGVPLAELVDRAPRREGGGGGDGRADLDDWATALVIALFQLRYHDRASAWSALVEARRNAFPRELMRAAMETVCELVAP